MSAEKRYYWLKLYDDFFGSMRIKKLRKLAGGDTYLIIYLKLQLKAMKTDGIIKYTGLEQNIADEIALDIDEQPDDVKVTLSFLVGCGLAETNAESSYMFLPYAVENTGSEGSGAQRVRDCRARKALQCNTGETPVKQLSNGEIDIEKEKEIEIDKSKKNGAERSDDRSTQQPEEPPVFLLTLNDGSSYGVTQSDVDHYSELYPAVDVAQEIRGMIGWLDANPAKRKTRAGIRRFVNNWLSRTQDQGGTHGWAGIFPKDAGKARGGSTNSGAHAGGYSQREVTEDEFGKDFYVDVMNRKRDGPTG